MFLGIGNGCHTVHMFYRASQYQYLTFFATRSTIGYNFQRPRRLSGHSNAELKDLL